jgi:hypothetical protein
MKRSGSTEGSVAGKNASEHVRASSVEVVSMEGFRTASLGEKAPRSRSSLTRDGGSLAVGAPCCGDADDLSPLPPASRQTGTLSETSERDGVKLLYRDNQLLHVSLKTLVLRPALLGDEVRIVRHLARCCASNQLDNRFVPLTNANWFPGVTMR